MTITLMRIIKYGLQYIGRNGWLSVATTGVMILALLVFHGLVISRMLAKNVVAGLRDKIDISVYFKNDASEEQILKISRDLEKLAEVKSVEYVSQDKALTIFKEKHQSDEVIAAAIQELDANPLLAALNIKAYDPAQYSDIADYLESADLNAAVEKVTYAQNQGVIDRLARLISAFEKFGLGTALFMAAMAALVIFNTIRIAIYSNREELNIMRLVGASNNFIKGPYIVAGIIYGLLAAVFSLIIAAPILAAASPYIQIFVPEINLSAYLTDHWPTLLSYQMIFGIGLGVVSTAVAIRRYLKI
jgi:cell division transport system permease protein